ncbi:MAG: hypothetical protein AB1664_01395 [Thermodesulfobacteriota bacterium]
MQDKVKKTIVTAWLTVLLFALLGNVHAWEVPAYLRFNGGARLWFSAIDGDLIQGDRTKLGFTGNMGLTQDVFTWELFASLRYNNIHALRLRGEPYTGYTSSANGSYQKVRNLRIGYDGDYYMSPQVLIGLNVDLDVLNLDTRVSNVTVGNVVYNYSETQTWAIPSIGLHGTFYPIIDGISLRPNISSRFNWWDMDSRSMWDWEVATAVDIPINPLWTWTIAGGYRMWNTKIDRSRDTIDMTRRGFYIETAILF